MVTPPRILIVAGPTYENLDGMRFLGNHSTGKTGIELAEAAQKRGWPTTLLCGPGVISKAEGAKCMQFESSDDLSGRLAEHFPEHDILIMAGTVTSHRPVMQSRSADTAKQAHSRVNVRIEPVPDVLSGLASRTDRVIVDFAVDSEDGLELSVQDKLALQLRRAIVSWGATAMGRDEITATPHRLDGQVISSKSPTTKRAFAGWLLENVC